MVRTGKGRGMRAAHFDTSTTYMYMYLSDVFQIIIMVNVFEIHKVHLNALKWLTTIDVTN